jgi:hypothetical protein
MADIVESGWLHARPFCGLGGHKNPNKLNDPNVLNGLNHPNDI